MIFKLDLLIYYIYYNMFILVLIFYYLIFIK